MKRREFVGLIYSAALALPTSAAAQQPSKVWRIGHVIVSTPERNASLATALEQRLADVGYTNGRLGQLRLDLVPQALALAQR
jgi:hypothetical protein